MGRYFKLLASLFTLFPAITSSLPTTAPLLTRTDNPACRSPNPARATPVVLIHGLFANEQNDLGMLAAWLESTYGFCTYGLTYGTDPRYPGIGGLKHINETAPVIAAYINQVLVETGASHVDLVGHSEGGLQSFYVPKFEASVKNKIRNIVALAPVTHGTTLNNLYDLELYGGPLTTAVIDDILNEGGCEACEDLLPNGAATVALNNGPIVQNFVDKVLIIATRYDELVTPVGTASFINEPKVKNMFIQDQCPGDVAGHAGIAFDVNTWNLVANWLDSSIAVPAICAIGQIIVKE